MKRKGMTLVELIVAMAIFTVVLLVAVGAFINMNNLRAVALSSRESQQKLRLAIEMISRYSRQAEKIVLSSTPATLDSQGNSQTVDMYFNIDTASPQGERFEIKQVGSVYKLYFYSCTPAASTDPECASWGTGSDLLGGDVELAWNNTPFTGYSGFKKNADIALNGMPAAKVAAPPSVSVLLAGRVNAVKDFYKNTFNIDTKVILENIK